MAFPCAHSPAREALFAGADPSVSDSRFHSLPSYLIDYDQTWFRKEAMIGNCIVDILGKSYTIIEYRFDGLALKTTSKPQNQPFDSSSQE